MTHLVTLYFAHNETETMIFIKRLHLRIWIINNRVKVYSFIAREDTYIKIQLHKKD